MAQPRVLPVPTADGWLTDDPETFDFFTRHSPPRPFGYSRQLAIDLRSWKPWIFWGPMLLGLALGLWSNSLVGYFAFVSILSIYVHMLRRVVLPYQRGPVVRARIEGRWGSHPLFPSKSIASAVPLAPGLPPLVSVVAESVLVTSASGGEPLEVLLLYDGLADYSSVLAIRKAG